MVMWCQIYQKRSEACPMVGTHLRMDVKDATVRQEILFGKFEEERCVDVLMGRETRQFKWMKEMMEDVVEINQKSTPTPRSH